MANAAAMTENPAANHGNGKHKKKRKPRHQRALPSSTSFTTRDIDAHLADQPIGVLVEPLDLDPNDPSFMEFAKIFDKFRLDTSPEQDREIEANLLAVAQQVGDEEMMQLEEEEKQHENNEADATKKLTRRQFRKMNKMTIAQLKQSVNRPEVVEWTDADAADPMLLVYLKSYRNTIPVPMHWNKKSRYLSSKRGIEKPPFKLPDYIRATGIQEMRDAGLEREAEQSLKSKQRERTRPKMGRIEIDYQKLHDAFFRYQTRPPNMSRFGEMYYEGKEFEAKLENRRPGQMSEELKAALNIPPLAPPPWLINMQRFGPPPAYPGLRIPGLNAPIPEGAQWGYHPGGWGRPPVDAYNRPLYGDVFGTAELAKAQVELPGAQWVVPPERELWGELEPEPEYDEEEEEEEEDYIHEEEEVEEEVQSRVASGLETPSGLISTVPSGLETPEHLELRKEVPQPRYIPPATSSLEEKKELYRVLPQVDTRLTGKVMGTQHVYDMRSDVSRRKGDVDVSIDLQDLEKDGKIDPNALKAKYDEQVKVSLILLCVI